MVNNKTNLVIKLTNTNLIAVLITCHNRKKKTLSCLQALFDQNGLGEEFTIEIFLVDDGSTDGTSKAIQGQFPEVNIIQGTGNLYWNRGMLLAWKTATAANDFDYYLWLNDDTFLFQNAFEILLQRKFAKSIICGTTKSRVDNIATYGGFISKPFQLLYPNGKYQTCNYCNGNCVLIPRIVKEEIGLLDPVFNHALGDFDYSRRAVKSGFEVKVSPDFIGICERHHSKPKWLNKSYSIMERLEFLYQPLSGCNPFEFFVLDRRSNGLLNAIFRFFSLHFKAIFPRF